VNERGKRHPRKLRHARRLADGTVVVTDHDDQGRVVRTTHYDATMARVLQVETFDPGHGADEPRRLE